MDQLCVPAFVPMCTNSVRLGGRVRPPSCQTGVPSLITPRLTASCGACARGSRVYHARSFWTDARLPAEGGAKQSRRTSLPNTSAFSDARSSCMSRPTWRFAQRLNYAPSPAPCLRALSAWYSSRSRSIRPVACGRQRGRGSFALYHVSDQAAITACATFKRQSRRTAERGDPSHSAPSIRTNHPMSGPRRSKSATTPHTTEPRLRRRPSTTLTRSTRRASR